MLRIGIMGLGDISKVHLKILQGMDQVKIVAACDPDETQWFEGENVRFYHDYQEMLQAETLDCVHVCLPHYLHTKATIACVLKGIHVFLEKPMSLHMEEVKKLLCVVEAHPEVRVNLCLQNRLNKTVVELKKRIESGEYGKVKGIKGIVPWHRSCEYYKAKPWRGSWELAGGGVMINQSIHTLDLMQWLVGPVESIYGSTTQILDYDIEVEDTASAHMVFENGGKGMFYATNANPYNSSVEIEVLLEKGRLGIRDNILYLWDEEGQQFLVEDDRVEGTKFYYGASHKTLIYGFYHMLEGKAGVYIPLDEGVASMAMIEGIKDSSYCGKPVKLEGYI